MKAKDYKEWMVVKATTNSSNARPKVYRDGEIWLCKIGENIGFENDGKGAKFVRPVLILKRYKNGNTCHVVPLSTTDKRTRYHYAFDGGTGKTSVALLSQSKTIDAMRLYHRIGTATSKDFAEIRSRIKEILSL
ncbi:MAG: type II toxin-antitoxin system PemK/MazF family toxin [Coriobacteriales bacterium]|jgi:mRNA interferase MazF|nr:type II toxin-antitoxin system PemK/MazF family toxin [Coriobacteriales bacterium]